MTSQKRTLPEITAIGCTIFTTIIVALYLMRPISDPDFFWHLKSGQWIWQHGTLPDVDPFSLSPPPADNLRAHFILTSYWLAQVIFAAMYALGGWWGIALLRAGMAGILAALFVSRCDLKKNPIQTGLLLLLTIQIMEVYPLERPQMFSFICFTALLVLLERYLDQNDGDNKIIIYGPAISGLMLVWANLHGGFFVGQVTLVMFLIIEGIKFSHPGLKPVTLRRYGGLVIIILAGLAASFLNPNPVDSLKLLFNVGNTNTFLYTTNIEYFSSLRILKEFNDYTIILNWLMMVLVAWVALTAIRKQDITWLSLLAGTAFMGCQHVRYMPFFLVAGLLFLCKADFAGAAGALSRTIILTASLISVFWFTRNETENFTRLAHGSWGVEDSFPVKAADFCSRNNLKGPVYNTYLWGGYLVWRLAPERTIFCDGRQLDPGRYWEYLNSTVVAQTDEPYWKELFRKHGIQTAIITLTEPSGQMNPLAMSMRMDREWAMVFAKDNSAVFVRKSGLTGVRQKAP